MLKFIKKHGILFGVIAVLLYMVIGLTAPFINYQEMDGNAKVQAEKAFDRQTVLEGTESVDRAMLVETNTAALEERIRLLNQAQERIILSTYDMRIGESTQDLIALLLHKADRGVSVNILVDGISGLLRMGHQEIFHVLEEHPNVEIKLYNRLNILLPWKTQGRMHDKYMIVDDIGYLAGGRNTFDYFLGEYDTDNSSFDREIFIYNTREGNADSRESSLFELEEYFDRMWESGSCTDFRAGWRARRSADEQAVRERLAERYDKLVGKYPQLFAEQADYRSMTYETQGVELLFNPTGIYGKEPVLFYQLTELMKAAGEPVKIHTPYIVCNEYMYETLAEVRGMVPEIELLTNSVENGDNFVASGDYMKNKKKVIATGVDIYEYDEGTSHHGKSVVIGNDISVIGSYNFDLRSTYVNTELMVAVRSRELTEELTDCLEAMKEKSRHVTDEDSYETPEGWVLPDLPGWKKAAMKLVGFLLQPFRCLI